MQGSPRPEMIGSSPILVPQFLPSDVRASQPGGHQSPRSPGRRTRSTTEVNGIAHVTQKSGSSSSNIEVELPNGGSTPRDEANPFATKAILRGGRKANTAEDGAISWPKAVSDFREAALRVGDKTAEVHIVEAVRERIRGLDRLDKQARLLAVAKLSYKKEEDGAQQEQEQPIGGVSGAALLDIWSHFGQAGEIRRAVDELEKKESEVKVQYGFGLAQLGVLEGISGADGKTLTLRPAHVGIKDHRDEHPPVAKQGPAPKRQRKGPHHAPKTDKVPRARPTGRGGLAKGPVIAERSWTAILGNVHPRGRGGGLGVKRAAGGRFASVGESSVVCDGQGQDPEGQDVEYEDGGAGADDTRLTPQQERDGDEQSQGGGGGGSAGERKRGAGGESSGGSKRAKAVKE
ncbi:hypothetical protein M427DRAFT_494399 [Gonapodya prolifera JEL478]|uniref:Uncharacterized protein n=1 Tax=Gonapodya prolifera (strain JEL478) TaxID=1344416 RepID=A0A139AZ26_GONPJ|nr:hypothetical protein M427DRAFT_494399 [Gonapodya prolifera JEL478]|eukprot:KXS21967.1 hypothetical protein M427DRAFT_494399 [Gonapodya prolifera JEL478]